jgi:putative intracellular protease/amidase
MLMRELRTPLCKKTPRFLGHLLTRRSGSTPTTAWFCPAGTGRAEGLQRFVADFFDADKPVAAICHGVVLAARSVSARTGKSILYGRKTTALTWQLEKSAYSMMRFFGRFWDPEYYRTYTEAASEPLGYRSVQSEVTRALQSPADFCDVQRNASDYFRKSSGLFRDSLKDDRPAWVVRDGRYVSARWPGDAHSFAATFAALLAEI